MFTDFLGAALNLTQLAGSESMYRLQFVDDSEAAWDISGVTFEGTVTALSDGTVYPLGVAASEADVNILGLSFPELALGNYKYELMAVDDSGDKQRIVYGQLLVLETSLELGTEEGVDYKTLVVREPGCEARSLQLRWLSTSIAQLSAEEAQAAAEAAKESAETAAETVAEAVKEAIEKAEAAADAAQAAADSVQETIDNVLGDAVDEVKKLAESVQETLDAATDFMAGWDEDVRSVIYIDPNTGTWVIGGVDTGVYAQGESGKSPYISTSGTWLYYDDENQCWVDSGLYAQGKDGRSPYINSLGNWVVWDEDLDDWYDTGIQAQGKDGLDGDKVVRIVVDSYDDIPQEGETCNGGYYYYVATPAKLVIRITGDITEDTTLTIDGVEVDLSGVIPQETVTEVSSMQIDAGEDTATLTLSSLSTSGHDTTPANQWLLGTLTVNGVAIDLTPLCLMNGMFNEDSDTDTAYLTTVLAGIQTLVTSSVDNVTASYQIVRDGSGVLGTVTITGDELEVSYDEMDASALPETAGYYAGWLALTTAEGAEGVDGLYDWYGVSNWAWAWLDGYFPSGTLKQITLRQDKWETSATTQTFNACYLQIWEMDDDVGEWVLLGTSNECYDTYTEGTNLVYTFDDVTLDGNLHHVVRASCEANLNLSWEYWIMGTDADGNTLTADRMRSSMIAAPGEHCYTMQPNGTTTHACVPALDFVSVTKSFTTATTTTEYEDCDLLDGVEKDGYYTKYYAFSGIDTITAEELNEWLSESYASFGECVASTNIEGNTEYKVSGELVTQEDGSSRLRFTNRGNYGGSVVGIITALTDAEMKATKLSWSLTDFWYPLASASAATEGWLMLAFETNEEGWYLVKSGKQAFVTGGDAISVEVDLAALGLTLASNLVYAVACSTGGGGSVTNALPTLTLTAATAVGTPSVDTASQLAALESAIDAAGIDGLTLAERTDSELVYTSEYDTVTVVWTAGLHCLSYDKCWTVYAWLVDENGEGSWQVIGERNDIATTKLYGLVKLGTDIEVKDGAPVGFNSADQMFVPWMEYTVPGTARVSTDETQEADSSGAVGLTSDGRVRAQSARADRFGAMRHSLSDQTETDCVGLNADGTTGIRWATLNDSGVVRLGSKFGQLNRIPYQQGVGATEDHKITNNLLYGGALQHQKKAAWSGKMEWLDEMESTEYYNADDYYIGVYTSDQFTQSEGSGMELLSATTTLLAGVYLAEDLTDERENAVGVASQIHAADLAEAAARQAADAAETAARQAADTAEASTRAEADTALDEKIDALAERTYTQSEVDALLSDLRSSLTSTLKAWVTAQGYTSLSAVNSLLGNYVKTTETVTEIQALTTEEFNNLTDRNDTTLYLN